ncbi:MAG: PQQ-binding-like beta-propeller repeat protein [Candidatus Poseidoniales archaeon]
MRETTPLWTFQGGASPSSLSMSLDGKFAGVGHKNGLTFLNESGRPVWNNKKIRRVRDISVSTRTGLMSIASDQKVLYLIDKGGKIRWHRELQSKAVATSISSRGTTIAVGTDEGRLIVYGSNGKVKWEKHLSNSDFPVNSVDISSDGQFIVAGTNYSRVYLYNIKGDVLWTKETSGEVLQTCISSNGDYVGYLTSDNTFTFGVKSSRILWEETFSVQPIWIDMTQTADFVSIGETPSKVTLFNKKGRKVWGFKSRQSTKGVMASGGGYLFLGGIDGVYKYTLEPYLQRLMKYAHNRIEKAVSDNLDTTTAKKLFQTAQSDFKKKNHLSFLVNIQQASRSAREARIIESDITPNERRLERNEMEKNQANITNVTENSEDEMISKLVQLAEMHENGILSEEEFLMAKSKLLRL